MSAPARAPTHRIRTVDTAGSGPSIAAEAASNAPAEHIEIRLDRDLKLNAGIVLRGLNPLQSVLFTLPRDRRVNSARLLLHVRRSPGLVAGSNLTIAINGTPVSSLHLDAESAVVDAAIPVEA